MKQTEVILHILYFLVTVIVTCETRFRHLGQTYNIGGAYGDGPTQSEPQKEKTYNIGGGPVNERYPKKMPFDGVPLSEGYLPGRYTKPLTVDSGRVISSRGFQGEIDPYSSNQVPQGRFITPYQPELTKTVYNGRESMLYDKALFVSPGMGYANPTKAPEKIRLDSRYPLYDGSQVVHPSDDQNSMYVFNRSPYYKFKRPSSGQTKMNIHRSPYGGTPEWSINRYEANKEPSLAYDGYVGVRSFIDNSSVYERGDLTVPDNYALYDSIPIGDSTDYIIVKKRILADYNFL